MTYSVLSPSIFFYIPIDSRLFNIAAPEKNLLSILEWESGNERASKSEVFSLHMFFFFYIAFSLSVSWHQTPLVTYHYNNRRWKWWVMAGLLLYILSGQRIVSWKSVSLCAFALRWIFHSDGCIEIASVPVFCSLMTTFRISSGFSKWAMPTVNRSQDLWLRNMKWLRRESQFAFTEFMWSVVSWYGLTRRLLVFVRLRPVYLCASVT